MAKGIVWNNVICQILRRGTCLLGVHHFRLLHVHRLKNGHRISHEIEIRRRDLARDLQVLDFVRILPGSLDGFPQCPGLGDIHYIILSRRAAPGIDVLCPITYLSSPEGEFHARTVTFLGDVDFEVELLARQVFRGIVHTEAVGPATYGDGEQPCACRDALRDDDGPERAVGLRAHHDAVKLGIADLGGLARGVVDGGLAGGVHKDDALLEILELSVIESGLLHESHADCGKLVVHRNLNCGLHGSDVLALAPEEVGSLISAESGGGPRGALVLLHFEVSRFHIADIALMRIIQIDVDVGVHVLIIDALHRGPLRPVEYIFHIVRLIAFDGKCPGGSIVL